jgi:hypothetical protein
MSGLPQLRSWDILGLSGADRRSTGATPALPLASKSGARHVAISEMISLSATPAPANVWPHFPASHIAKNFAANSGRKVVVRQSR